MAFGALCQPAVLQVEQPFLPRVFALAKAVVRRHPFLLPPSRGAHHHPNTLPFRFQADGEVDPAHPEVRVSLAGQGSLAPRGEILRPTLLEPHDPRGGRSPGRSPFESAARSRGRCEPPGGGRPRPVGPHAVRCRCPPPYPSLISTPCWRSCRSNSQTDRRETAGHERVLTGATASAQPVRRARFQTLACQISGQMVRAISAQSAELPPETKFCGYGANIPGRFTSEGCRAHQASAKSLAMTSTDEPSGRRPQVRTAVDWGLMSRKVIKPVYEAPVTSDVKT